MGVRPKAWSSRIAAALDGVGDDDRSADGTVPADEHGGVSELVGGLAFLVYGLVHDDYSDSWLKVNIIINY
jgi:hypothetical protein